MNMRFVDVRRQGLCLDLSPRRRAVGFSYTRFKEALDGVAHTFRGREVVLADIFLLHGRLDLTLDIIIQRHSTNNGIGIEHLGLVLRDRVD